MIVYFPNGSSRCRWAWGEIKGGGNLARGDGDSQKLLAAFRCVPPSNLPRRPPPACGTSIWDRCYPKINPPGPPMTLGNMCELGVRHRITLCAMSTVP
jgi:hypothetical protein